jgi:peroxiredoxin
MKKFIFSAICVLLLISCNEQPGYVIKGTVDRNDLNGDYIYLYEYGVKDADPIDSALIENKSFTFKGIQESPVLRLLTFKDGRINKDAYFHAVGSTPYSLWFLLDNSKLNVEIAENSSITGSSENEDLAAYMREMDKLDDEAEKIDKDAENAEEKYNDIFTKSENISKDFILHHNNSLIAATIFYNFRHSISEKDRRTIINSAGETFKSAPNIDKIIDHLAVLDKVAIGKQFTDFKMADTDGNIHSLSEYVGNGKIVLIDFWASWCPPCRRDMPQLVEVYNKYKNQRFEIVGISLDSDKAAWEKGIQDLQISWPQLSDLQGWKNAGAALYGVNSIPHTILVGEDGTILDKDIHADKLDDKIAELLK